MPTTHGREWSVTGRRPLSHGTFEAKFDKTENFGVKEQGFS